MSWMIPIPAGTPDTFAATVAAARATLDTQLADADDTTKAAAHAQADAATTAAQALIDSGVLADGLVSGALSGTIGNPWQPYTTVAVQLSCAPVES